MEHVREKVEKGVYAFENAQFRQFHWVMISAEKLEGFFLGRAKGPLSSKYVDREFFIDIRSNEVPHA